MTLAAAAPPAVTQTRPVVLGRQFIVSSCHYLATQAAFAILESGGNAIDAGVAAALVLGVVHSDQVNIAGVAPMIIWISGTRELVTIDGVGTWPRTASCKFFQDNRLVLRMRPFADGSQGIFTVYVP